MSASRWGRWWAATGLLALVAAGCGSGEGEPQPTPPTQTTPVAAADCASSDVLLPQDSSVPGVTFTLSTDPTGTSLLMKNTGELSAVVIPDEDGTTRLTTAPYANPTDELSAAALEAVRNTGYAPSVPGMPFGIAQDQIYFVPPEWAVCALSDRIGVVARTRYLQDKQSSVMYYTTKRLGGELSAYVTPQQMKNNRTLVSCAQGAGDVVQRYPGLEGLDLYAEVIGDGSACRSAYKLLLSNDEQATRTVQKKALDFLERSPRLLKTTEFVLALAHR